MIRWPEFPGRKGTLSKNMTGILIGDPRIRGIFTDLPGTGSVSLSLPQGERSDPYAGIVVPVERTNTKKMSAKKRLAFIGRSKRIDPLRLGWIPGSPDGNLDWWTKLPLEWGNPQEIYPMIHLLGALVPVLQEAGTSSESILCYPVPAFAESSVAGVAFVCLAAGCGLVVWRDGSSATNPDAFQMGRRPLIDRVSEIVSREGRTLSSETICWIRDDRNRPLGLWSFVPAPEILDAQSALIDRALENPPLVYDSPVVRARRTTEQVRKFGPFLGLVLGIGVILWYYENIILTRDPRTIAALASKRRALLTQNIALERESKTLEVVRADLRPKPWTFGASVLEYVSGGLEDREISLRVSGNGGFFWSFSGVPLKGLTATDVRKGLVPAVGKMGLVLGSVRTKTDDRLDFRVKATGEAGFALLQKLKTGTRDNHRNSTRETR